MKRYFMVSLLFALGMTACGEKAPVDWMYAEYKSLFLACPDLGKKVGTKSTALMLTYTWSCPYPKDFEKWLAEFEKQHLNPRGWVGQETQTPYTWKTYCSSYQKVVMRIVKVETKKTDEDDRLWISLRFPGDECSRISAQAK